MSGLVKSSLVRSSPAQAFRTPAEAALIARFDAEKASLPGAETARAAAFARFQASGLPSRRVESYHYTDLKSLMRDAGRPVNGGGPSQHPVRAYPGFTPVILVNGRPSFSDGVAPAGVAMLDIETALLSGRCTLGQAMGDMVDPIVDLNTAFVRSGLFIAIDSECVAKLHLAFVDTLQDDIERMPGMPSFLSRIVVMVGKGAELTLVESHVGPAGIAYQNNSVVELVLAEDAKANHIRVNQSGGEALMLSTLAARLDARAALTALNFSTGGAVARHQIFVTCAGENARLTLRGATMLRASQHHDTTLVVDHAVPHGESRELFRTVLDGSAQGVFQGKIIVRPGAQKTDGQMASNAILLSDEAGMANKPELEIFADDVVCAHGATCGALDESQLFYLMARGLPRAEAEALLTEAFVGEVLDLVEDEALRADLTTAVAGWMQARRAA